MKKILTIVLFAASLAVSTRAAILAGFEAGYLTDRGAAFYSARLGYEFKSNASFAHQVEFEIGYTRKSDSHTATTPSGLTAVFNSTERIMPVMLNYRGAIVSGNKLSGYFGAGLGVAGLKFSSSPATPTPGLGSGSFSDNPLAWQGFAGLSYKAGDTTLLHLGLKYIWFDDFKVSGRKIPVDADFVISAGISIRF